MRPVEPPSRLWEWSIWFVLAVAVTGLAGTSALLGSRNGWADGLLLFLASLPLALAMFIVGWLARRRRVRMQNALTEYDAMMTRIAVLAD
jgi:hypothetical protein